MQNKDVKVIKISKENRTKISHEQKKQLAKEMYFNYNNITHISTELDVKLPTLKSWIYGPSTGIRKGWKAERELSQHQLLKDLSSNKRGMLQHMVDGALFLLHDYVEKARLETIKNGNPITIKEAEKLTSILTNLHRIVQDEQSNADDDAGFTKPTSPKELQDRVRKADPFTEKQVIVVKTVEEDEDIILEEDI